MCKFLKDPRTNWKYILIIVILAAIVGGGILAYQYLWLPKEEAKNSQKPVACTQEAKICPDGSTVGRTGPNCEFTTCPTPTPDETADWKTYRNEEYGFEIKYPQDWELGDSSFINPSCDFNRLAGVGCVINFSVKQNAGLIPIDKWIDDNLYSLYFPTNKESFIVDGIEGRKADVTLVHTLRGVTVVFMKGRLVYQFLTGEEASSALYQMLSTFRFIESGDKKLLVYLTDKKYDGNLGGRSGADAKCISPAELNCESGTVHSLITVDKNDSIINMAKNYNLNTDIPIYWYNRDTKGTLILANNWDEMVGGDGESIPNIINGQEGTGKNTWSGDFPWTGGKGNIDSLNNCNQWTSNGGNLETAEGPYGTIGGVDKEFLFASDGWAGISFSMECKNQRYLRCICEGNIE